MAKAQSPVERIIRIDVPDPSGQLGRARKTYRLTTATGKSVYLQTLPKGTVPGAIINTKTGEVAHAPKDTTKAWKLNDQQLKRLTDADAKPSLSVINTLQKNGFDAYLVGGAVRDLLMGKTPKDFDVVTSAKPADVRKIFPKVYNVGEQFAITPVMVDGQWVEIATYRTEGDYKDGRHPDNVAYAKNAAEDVSRRDFTINGLYLDPKKKQVVDTVGGVKDIENKTVRAIGNPVERFGEDALRMLRAVRFAATLDFKIETGTAEAIKELCSSIQNISNERIRDEILKTMKKGAAAKGVSLMNKLGLLDYVLPEVADMRGVEQPKQYHPEGDVYKHTLKMLKIMDDTVKNPSDTLILGTLLHDIGKPKTQEVRDNKTTFHNHAAVGAELAQKVVDRMNLPREVRDNVIALIGNHMKMHETRKMSNSTLRKLFMKPYFEDLLTLSRLDAEGSSGDTEDYNHTVKKYQEFLDNKAQYKEPLIQGRHLIDIGYKPGQLIGEIIAAVREAQLEGKLKTTEEALQFIRQHWKPQETSKACMTLYDLGAIVHKLRGGI